MKCMGLVAVAIAACGGGLNGDPVYDWKMAAAPAVTPLPSATAELRALMYAPISLGGIAFADPACAERFGEPGQVGQAGFDAFAACLGALHLETSARKSGRPETTVATYAPGYELEAYVAGGQLGYIGFAGRGGKTPDVPTITPETLESLRTAGEAHPAVQIARRTHLKVCVMGKGDAEVPKVFATSTTHDAELKVLGAAIGDWRFRGFAVPACAIVAFDPVGKVSAEVDRIPRARTFAKSGKPRRFVDTRMLEKLRVGGEQYIAPDRAVSGMISRDQHALHRELPVVGVFEVCLDEDGRFESGEMLKSTGYHAYDARIVHALERWTFRPYLEDGAPQPACMQATVTYEQKYR